MTDQRDGADAPTASSPPEPEQPPALVGAGRPPVRVTTLELFFDLVFVFTVTQVAMIVERGPSWPSAAQAVLELLVIFWMYGGFAWFTNTLGSQAPRQQAIVLLGMAAFFAVSLAVPGAFGADARTFGWAYLILTLIHLGGFTFGGAEAVAQAFRQVGWTNLLAAGLVLAAGYAGQDARWPLWAGAVAVQWGAALVTGSASRFEIDAAHFGERHGQMILIVLGESLVSVAVAAGHLKVSAGLITGALCGLAATAAFWFCYFAGDDDRAAEAFKQHRRNALISYDLPHVLMMTGVLSVAAGSRLSLPELTHTTSLAAAALLAAGAALYLVGLALFRAVLRFAPVTPRLAAAAVLIALIPVGRYAGAAQELAAIAAVLAALIIAERRLAQTAAASR